MRTVAFLQSGAVQTAADPVKSVARRRFLQKIALAGAFSLAASPRLLSKQGGETPALFLPEWPSADDPAYWARARQEFSIPFDEAYFNSGTLGACPRPVLDAVIDSMREMETTIAHYDYRANHPECIAGYEPQTALRDKAARVINARGEEIALTQNATMGINFIANGLDLKAGDEILLTDQEHPGAMGAWDLRARREGIVVKKLPIAIPAVDPANIVQTFADAIGPRTRVMAVPHITSRHGIVLPVAELCAVGRERGLFTLIDGAQALGQLRVDVKKIECDAYAASPHKWMLAPPGNGLLYVRKTREKDIWATLASAQWDNYTPEAGLFRLMQFGTANEALLAGLDAAINFYEQIGPERIERRIIGLADNLRQGLQAIKGVTITSPVHPALAGSIVTYSVAGLTGVQLQDELWSRKKYRVREGGGGLVRQSVHYYNSPEEIAGTLEFVKSLAAA